MKILAGVCLFGMIGAACGGNPQDTTFSALEPAAGEERSYYRETPSGDYLSSQFAQNQRDWKAAEEYLSRVIEHDPENDDLKRRAMILAMGAGETSRAIAQARKIIQTDPHNDLALLIVALDQFGTQKYTDAQVTLKQMRKGSIGDLLGPVMTAWAIAGSGKMDTTGFQDLAFHDYHAFLIADYLGKKDMLPTLAEKISADPSVDYYVVDKVALTLARNGEKAKAVALYKDIGKMPEADDAIIAEKIAALSQKNLPGPIENPAHGASEALFDMARAMLRESSYESAKIFTRMALHLQPKFDEARLILASLLTQDERYDQAIAYYQSINKTSPMYADAQRQAAALLEEQGKREQATAILEGLYRDYGDINALVTIGDLYRNADEFPQAIAAYDRAAKAIGGKKIPEKYWSLLYVRGMAYERNGQLNEAERDLKAALAYRPDHPFILNYLGYSWADQGRNLNEALKMLEKASELEPEDGYITDSLGWALYKAKKYKEALPHLEKAVSLLPYDPEINDHLGDVYWQVGRKNEARFQWERSLNNGAPDDKKPLIEAKIAGGVDAIPAAAETPAVAEAAPAAAAAQAPLAQ